MENKVIVISKIVKSSLDNIKIHKRETYNQVIERLIIYYKENMELKQGISNGK